MPTLDEFKEKQKKAELKRKEVGFKPKRYAPYLLHEEIVKISEKKMLYFLTQMKGKT